MKQGLARAIAVLTVAFASAAAHAQTIPDHPHFWGGGWGWGHMIFGPLMMIAFVGAIVVVAVLLIRWLGICLELIKKAARRRPVRSPGGRGRRRGSAVGAPPF